MPGEEITLKEEHRSKLDGIVADMEKNGEKPEDIQFVVDDFKSKYGVKKKLTPSPLPSPSESGTSVSTTGASVPSGVDYLAGDINSDIPSIPETKPAQIPQVQQPLMAATSPLETTAKDIINLDPNIAQKQEELNPKKEALGRGLAKAGSLLLQSPTFAYDALISSTNYLLNKPLGLPSAPTWNELGKADESVYKTAIADLEASVNRSNEEKSKRYDQEINQYLFGDKKNISKGLDLLSENIIESIPTSLALAFAASQNPTAAGAIGTAAFGADSKRQLDEKTPNMPEDQKMMWSSLMGGTEMAMESLGLTKLGPMFKDILKRSGKEAVESAGKEVFDKTVGKIVKQYMGVQAEEVLSEMGNTWLQNVYAKASGLDENRKPMDGVWDSGLTAFGQGAVMTTPTALLDIAVTKKTKARAQKLKEQKDALAQDLQNPEVSDEVKQALSNKLKNLNEEEANLAAEENELMKDLDAVQQARVSQLNQKSKEIEAAMSDELVSEESKKALQTDLENIDNEVQTVIKESKKNAEQMAAEAKAQVEDNKAEIEFLTEVQNLGFATEEQSARLKKLQGEEKVVETGLVEGEKKSEPIDLGNEITEMPKVGSVGVEGDVVEKDGRYSMDNGSYADIDKKEDEWRIEYIESKKQRGGDGTKIINKIISDAKEQGVKTIGLQTGEGTGYGFVKKLGFKEVGENKDRNNISMELSLKETPVAKEDVIDVTGNKPEEVPQENPEKKSVSELDSEKMNLERLKADKKESEKYLIDNDKNLLADKKKYHEQRLASTNKEIKKSNAKIKELEGVGEKLKESKPEVIGTRKGKNIISEEDKGTYTIINYEDGTNEYVRKSKEPTTEKAIEQPKKNKKVVESKFEPISLKESLDLKKGDVIYYKSKKTGKLSEATVHNVVPDKDVDGKFWGNRINIGDKDNPFTPEYTNFVKKKTESVKEEPVTEETKTPKQKPKDELIDTEEETTTEENDKASIQKLDDDLELLKGFSKKDLAEKKFIGMIERAYKMKEEGKITRKKYTEYKNKAKDVLGGKFDTEVESTNAKLAVTSALNKVKEKLLGQGYEKITLSSTAPISPKTVSDLIDLAGYIAHKAIDVGKGAVDVANAIKEAVRVVKLHPTYKKLTASGELNEKDFEKALKDSLAENKKEETELKKESMPEPDITGEKRKRGTARRAEEESSYKPIVDKMSDDAKFYGSIDAKKAKAYINETIDKIQADGQLENLAKDIVNGKNPFPVKIKNWAAAVVVERLRLMAEKEGNEMQKDIYYKMAADVSAIRNPDVTIAATQTGLEAEAAKILPNSKQGIKEYVQKAYEGIYDSRLTDKQKEEINTFAEGIEKLLETDEGQKAIKEAVEAELERLATETEGKDWVDDMKAMRERLKINLEDC